MNQNTIYLDSDGLFYDWAGYVAKHLGNLSVDELNALPHTERSQILSKLYATKPNTFYDLKPFDGAVEFLEAVNGLGVEWKVLTALSGVHFSPTKEEIDKTKAWERDFGVNAEKIIFASIGNKHTFAKHSGCLLVDDFHRNVDDWVTFGGSAILSPNRTPDYDALLSMIKVAVCTANL